MKLYQVESSFDYEGSLTDIVTVSLPVATRKFNQAKAACDCHCLELVQWQNGKKKVLRRAYKVSYGLPMSESEVKS